MALDLIISNARLAGWDTPVEIGIAAGRIAEIAPVIASTAPRDDAAGALAFGGFVECHIHLDKAGILARCPICEGTLKEAVALTAKAKAGFTVADVRARATKVVEQAILHGTTRLRSFVEIDPRAGFRSFEALLEVQRDHAWAIDIALCAFAQEGLTQEMATYGMLDEALGAGADARRRLPLHRPRPDRPCRPHLRPRRKARHRRRFPRRFRPRPGKLHPARDRPPDPRPRLFRPGRRRPRDQARHHAACRTRPSRRRSRGRRHHRHRPPRHRPVHPRQPRPAAAAAGNSASR